jgi:riboflavin kinase/FMN adenylyltransferase
MSESFGPSALTIGNFDGVHAGHRVLLRTAAQIAQARGWKPSVLTFNPHPARIVAPARAPRMITSFERRAELMAEEGIQQVMLLPFTRDVSLWSPEYFVEHLLVGRLGVKAVVVGDDFHFGHKQAGDRRLLEELGIQHGFEVVLVPPVEVRGQRVSSSLVREMVGAGRVARAARLLTKPFELQGRVVSGHGVGSKQTVPTLNLEPDSEVLPLSGVYVTRTRDLDRERRWESITNVGTRPTFDGDALTIETFLLQPLEPPAPERIRVEFLWRVRDERKFASAEDLKAQILRDVQRAQRIHRATSPLLRVR